MENFNTLSIIFEEKNIIASLIFFVSFMILRILIVSTINKWTFKNSAEKRKKIILVKNTLVVFFLFGLFLIWGSELRALALSLVAVAAALVIATKEMILCLMGGFLKASTKLFEVGDRIQIKSMRGEVTDHNLLMTYLFEIGPGEKSNQYNGKLLKIPNSLFLSEIVLVEPKGNHYNLSVFKIPVTIDENIGLYEEALLESAIEITRPYLDEASKHIKKICKEQHVSMPSIEPRILYDLIDKDTLELHVRLPVPFDRKSYIEKQLIDSFFEKKQNLTQNINLKG